MSSRSPSVDPLPLNPSEQSRGAVTIPYLGSGLKRPLERGMGDQLKINKRRRRDSVAFSQEVAHEDSWEGCDSTSDSSSKIESSDDQTDKEDAEVSGDTDSSECESSQINGETTNKQDRKERSSVFKAWALQQRNEAVNSASISTNELQSFESTSKNIEFTLREPENDPLPPELQITSSYPTRKAFSVQVERSQNVQDTRLELPIVAEEQKILESIYNNPVVVICGATGSGKTTQIPQFLFEAGFGNLQGPSPGLIGITQPRRVAAVSMSKRVATELADTEDKVSYQIRFDTTVGHRTAIKFMTDGILIREIANDISLSKYSVIVIDEAHERSANTDILIGMVSRIVDLREDLSKENEKIKPLKLIIMSATLSMSAFLDNSTLFRRAQPPLVQIEGRQYPITVHFARQTKRDYVEEVFNKICKGHRKLPPGGMLVFLTGQNEIELLSRRLKEALADRDFTGQGITKAQVTANDAPLEAEDLTESWQSLQGSTDAGEMIDEGDDYISDDNDDEDFVVEEDESPSQQVRILPLFSQLQTKDQLRVFQTPPKDTRLIIIATNVAETSLTIPNVRYVFDCGRAKTKSYDRSTGIQSFEVGWISKASAAQRAGRAGRTGPGHCYRLYSSAVFERDFEEHTQPEILRMPVEGVVLQLKSMNLQHVVNFPFPTPPDRDNLLKAEQLLLHLGAISNDGKLTALGRIISSYPLSPRYAKMLAIGSQHDCMPYTLALVAALATPNLFIPESHLGPREQPHEENKIYIDEDRLRDEKSNRKRQAFRQAHHILSTHSSTSDAMKALTALCAYAHTPEKDAFCNEMFLSSKAVAEASSLFSQLSTIVHSTQPAHLPNPSKIILSQLASPSPTQIAALQQFLAAAFIDQIAIRASEAPNAPSDLGPRPTRAIDVPYLPLLPINPIKRSSTSLADVAVYLHPSSLLAHRPVKNLPTYIVYDHLQRAAPSTIGDPSQVKQPKTRMHPLCAVTGRQLASLARGTSLLEYGKPIGKVEDMDFGRKRVCWVVPSLVTGPAGGGGMGWPLPAVKVQQVKKAGGGWEVEKVIG